MTTLRPKLNILIKSNVDIETNMKVFEVMKDGLEKHKFDDNYC